MVLFLFIHDIFLFPRSMISPQSSMVLSLNLTLEGDTSTTRKSTETNRFLNTTGTSLIISTTSYFIPVAAVILLPVSFGTIESLSENSFDNKFYIAPKSISVKLFVHKMLVFFIVIVLRPGGLLPSPATIPIFFCIRPETNLAKIFFASTASQRRSLPYFMLVYILSGSKIACYLC